MIACNHHRPVSPPGLRALCAGDANLYRSVHKKGFAMARRIDPLTKSLRKTVIAVRDILGAPTGL
jgi:hypothetical protein